MIHLTKHFSASGLVADFEYYYNKFVYKYYFKVVRVCACVIFIHSSRLNNNIRV